MSSIYYEAARPAGEPDEPTEPGPDEPSDPGDEPVTGSAGPATDADDGSEPSDDGPEPPLWVTVDGSVLHLPRGRVRRFLHPGRRPPRRGRGTRERSRRRQLFRNLGRLARRARRVGTIRSRSGRRYPVFGASSRSRRFRIVAHPRRQRFEILYVGPDTAGETGELETGAARPSRTELRRAARERFFQAYPRLRGKVEVHHRIPLEWSHLFPNADPNRLSNLQGLASKDHLRKATDLWTAFRNTYQRRRQTPKPAEVLRFAALVDRSLNLPYPL